MSLRLRKVRKEPEILVIDEAPMALELIKNTLDSKIKVTLAKTAREAWINFLKTTPDLFFLQIHMPDLNGFKVLQMIKLIDPNAYVVMVTNERKDEEEMLAQAYGADGYIIKPYDTEKIIDSFASFQQKYKPKK